jgi:hypothetical protein
MDEREMQASGSPDTPNVDDHGQLGMHCTQCGASLDPSSEFCTICAAEVSGGETPDAGQAQRDSGD